MYVLKRKLILHEMSNHGFLTLAYLNVCVCVCVYNTEAVFTWVEWNVGRMEWNLYYKLWVISEIVYNFHSFNHSILTILTKNLTHMFWKECWFHLFIIFFMKNFNSLIFNHYCLILSPISIKLVHIVSFHSPLIPFHEVNTT